MGLNWEGSPPFGRRISLIHTLDLLAQRKSEKPQIIVEIGTSERYSPDGLGNALLAFGWYALKLRALVKSVDSREGAIINSRKIVAEYVPEALRFIESFHSDAASWAETIETRVDLCYMDAGYELECDPDYSGFAAKHELPSNYIDLFEAFPESSWKGGSLMLFDDTDPTTYRVKGSRLIPYLLDRGWQQINLNMEPVFPMTLIEKI